MYVWNLWKYWAICVSESIRLRKLILSCCFLNKKLCDLSDLWFIIMIYVYPNHSQLHILCIISLKKIAYCGLTHYVLPTTDLSINQNWLKKHITFLKILTYIYHPVRVTWWIYLRNFKKFDMFFNQFWYMDKSVVGKM